MIRTLLAALLLTGYGVIAFAEEVPPIVLCSVMPYDAMQEPRVIFVPSNGSGQLSPEATLHITLTDDNFRPIPGVFIEAIPAESYEIVCICEDAVLTGYTDDQGQLELNLAGGGFCFTPQALEIHANCVQVRVLDRIVSPDWDGRSADCRVNAVDFVAFGASFLSGGPGPFDFTGDGRTDGSDFVLFGRAWARGCVR